MNGKRVVIGGFFVVPVTFYCYISVLRTLDMPSEKMLGKPPKPLMKTFALDLPGCQIPNLDPLHPSVAYLVKVSKPLDCTKKLPAPVLPGEDPRHPSIRIVRTALRNYGANITCSYRALRRRSEHSTTAEKRRPIVGDRVNVTDEFVEVECSRQAAVVYRDFFPFIQRKKEVEKRCRQAEIKNKSKGKPKFSILLLGMDSVSKLQYLRHMKKTDAYIRKNLTFVEFIGYNKIGKNTYPNMVAMMTGHLEPELEDTSKRYMNILPLIWNDFSKAGYRTLFSEDIPSIAMFNYARRGFDSQPTDYYLRPYSLAVEHSSVLKKGKRGCFNHRLEADVVLNWTGDLFDAFPEDPLFALTFLTRLSHDSLNELSLQDEPYLRLIQRLNDSGHLNRTVVFFFSDHGFRFGDIRTTYVGRVEGKLPFLFVLVPPWFPTQYPDLFANLKANGERLTTPLDIYATLQGLLHFPKLKGNISESRSMDLLQSVVSPQRTCDKAGILFQWCSCSRLQRVTPSEPHVIEASKKLVNKINEMTNKYRDQCAEIQLDEVKEGTEELVHLGESNDENASRNYQVTFSVKPSGGAFEGTVWHLDHNKYSVQPGLERVNLYGNQSSCIDVAALKPFCYCENS